jgi:5-methylcytosine-specific restriction enzyme subunit McrC
MGVVAEQVESASVDADGYIGRIPVRNLWLLMLYASDLFRTRGIGNVGLEDNPDDLPDLVAEILAHAVEVRQRRRLNLGYRSRDAVLNRVRGRIDVLNTERHRLLDRGLVACRFDELTIDTPRNRFVRAALETISRIVRGRTCLIAAAHLRAA